MQAQTGARTLIVDFDYHHGNGTQAVSGNGLSYVSTHGYPAYPGTGGPNENYALDSGDAIVNLPFPPHALGTEAFIAAWEALLPRVAQHVRPGLIVVSAGFDYAAGDPVGDLGVDISAAAHLAQTIRDVAESHCNGRVAYVLEGGYDTRTLEESIGTIIDAHAAQPARASAAERNALPPAQRTVLSRIESLL
jgi:acetoin utilization deacetylase AcuC-like enzyme